MPKKIYKASPSSPVGGLITGNQGAGGK